MKKFLIISIIAGILTSCLNDEFLQKDPLDQLVESTVFTTYNNFKTFSWKFYGLFPNYRTGGEFYDGFSDNTVGKHSFVWGTVTVPNSDENWTFSDLRGINLMLDNIDKSTMEQKDKDHWRSVGYFFKSYEYFRLMSRYGNVPWLEKSISEADTAILFGHRTSRLEVAKKILDMLLFAKDNIKVNGEGTGTNTINRDVVLALISRYGLFEGTWQKYHELTGGPVPYTTYLQASYDASLELVNKYPNLISNYDEEFNSENLLGKPGILLCKINLSTDNRGHNASRFVRTSSTPPSVSSDIIQAYLCTDGKPIWTTTSTTYSNTNRSDISMYEEFRNRDRRLYYSVCPPYKLVPASQIGKKVTLVTTDISLIQPTGVPADQEFITVMAGISGTGDPSSKRLPILQWEGKIILEQPHFSVARYNLGAGFVHSTSGYYLWKYYNLHTPVHSANLVNSTDAPVFRMGEVMVNHAEAAFELGLFTQTEADRSINRLRKRAFVADMVVAGIDNSFDPMRDPTVPPVLWEIRRERRIELFAEGKRFDDLRRWKKGEYLNKELLGVYIKKSDLEDMRHIGSNPASPYPAFALKLDRTGNEGRISINGIPTDSWKDAFYLYPIPKNQLTMNPNLEQNPGYEGL